MAFDPSSATIESTGFDPSSAALVEDSPTPETDKATAATKYLVRPLEAIGNYAKGMIPQSWDQAARMANIPTSWTDPSQLVSFAFPMAKPMLDLSQNAWMRSQQIREAEKTPPFSPERWAAGIGTVGDIAGIGAVTEGALTFPRGVPRVEPPTPGPIAKPPIQAPEFMLPRPTLEPIPQAEVQGPLAYEGPAPVAPPRPAPTVIQGERPPIDVRTATDRFNARVQEGQALGKQINTIKGAGLSVPRFMEDRLATINADIARGPQFGPEMRFTAKVEEPEPVVPETRFTFQFERPAMPAEALRQQAAKLGVIEQQVGGGETYAIKPSDAQMEARTTPLGVQERPSGPELQAGRSDQDVGTAQGEAPGQLPQEAPIAGPSGISTERLQNLYGEDAVLINKGKGAKAWQAAGEADKRDAYDVLSKAQRRGIATPEDTAKLRNEHQKLLSAARAQYGTPRYNELAQQAADFANAMKKVAHGPASDTFRALQEADRPAYDSPADFDNILRERMNREASLPERKTFERAAQEVQKKNGDVSKAADEAQKRLARYKPKETMKFDDAVDQIRKQIADLTKDCGV